MPNFNRKSYFSPKLYLLTDQSPLSELLHKLEAALAVGGVGLLQIRRKHKASAVLHHEALAITELCQRYGVPVLLNDDAALAARLGLGVHLGQGDGSVVQARTLLGGQALIGVTCHDSMALAQDAERLGADYVAFGAMFHSQTKPDAKRADFSPSQIDTLAKMQQRGLKICVIGGIGLENLGMLKKKLQPLTPDYIAVTDDVLGRVDTAARALVWAAALADW